MRPLAMVAAPKIMAAFGLATEPLKRTEPSEPDTTVVNAPLDRKSTRLNSSHSQISYAVFCLKKRPDLLLPCLPPLLARLRAPPREPARAARVPLLEHAYIVLPARTHHVRAAVDEPSRAGDVH